MSRKENPFYFRSENIGRCLLSCFCAITMGRNGIWLEVSQCTMKSGKKYNLEKSHLLPISKAGKKYKNFNTLAVIVHNHIRYCTAFPLLVYYEQVHYGSITSPFSFKQLIYGSIPKMYYVRSLLKSPKAMLSSECSKSSVNKPSWAKLKLFFLASYKTLSFKFNFFRIIKLELCTYHYYDILHACMKYLGKQKK